MGSLQVAVEGTDRDVDYWVERLRWHTMDTAFVPGGQHARLHNHARDRPGQAEGAHAGLCRAVHLLLAARRG
jgi:hypothetical protein